MFVILLSLFLFPVTSSLSGSVADVVLSCSLVEEGGGMGGLGGGALFTRDEATLVLRDLPVTPDPTLDTLTPFKPPPPDSENLIFEGKVTSLQIPEADSLLHADCNEQEVTCEISRYFPRGEDGAGPVPGEAFFIGSVQLEGGGVSLTLVLRAQPVGEEPEAAPLTQTKLQLPLSQSGTILTEVVFVVFTVSPSVSAHPGDSALLPCGFRQATPIQEVTLEWRLQHKGSGRRVLGLRAEQEFEEPVVVPEREGASVEVAQLQDEGMVSLHLTEVAVKDEGTYICTVGSGLYQAQQIVQLHISKPPTVSLSPVSLVLREGETQRVSCHCEHYYPLDVQVEWLSLPPASSKPLPISQGIYFSSHRQHSDSTYSLSAHLSLDPSALPSPAGTTFTCTVTHPALHEPITASVTVSAPEESRAWLIVGVVLASLLFLLALYWTFR